MNGACVIGEGLMVIQVVLFLPFESSHGLNKLYVKQKHIDTTRWYYSKHYTSKLSRVYISNIGIMTITHFQPLNDGNITSGERGNAIDIREFIFL